MLGIRQSHEELLGLRLTKELAKQIAEEPYRLVVACLSMPEAEVACWKICKLPKVLL
jgi:hypothetical protein